jgi:probable HAF family extracellular repeat protein
MFSRWANSVNRVLGFPPVHRRTPHHTTPQRTRPTIEVLEDRCLLSSYNVTEITAYGGGYPPPTYRQGPVSAINNASVTQVAGTALARPGAYVWDSIHGLQQLGTVNNEAQSGSISINDAGQVVGYSSTTTEKYDKKTGFIYYTTKEDGFLWSSSAGMKSLASNVYPVGINNFGEIAGNPTVIQQALLWNGKQWIQLGILPGGTTSQAFGINDYGQVVGLSRNGNSSFYEGFLWTPSSPDSTSGSMIDLGSFMSNGGSTAVAINGQGWVTGNAAVPLSQPIGDIIGVDHAYLWKPSSANGTTGKMIDLGTLDPNANGGLGQSWGLAINSSGVVVGQSNPTGATSSSQTDAVIWQPNGTGGYTLSDLNNLISSGSGWLLHEADAINDSGQIVVEATNSSDFWYTLLLTPTTTTPALSAMTAPPQTQPAAASPITSTTSPRIAASGGTSSAPILASPTQGNSIDPAAASVALSLSPFCAMPAAVNSPALSFSPAALLPPSLTSNLPPAGASQPGWTTEAASDRVFANLDDGLSLAQLVDVLALAGGSSDGVISPHRRV